MTARTAAWGMCWLMFAVIVIPSCITWRRNNPLERGPWITPPIAPRPLPRHVTEMLGDVQHFCEEEGLPPKNLDEVLLYTHSTKDYRELQSIEVPGKNGFIVNYIDPAKNTKHSVQLHFLSDGLYVFTRDWASGPEGFYFSYPRDRPLRFDIRVSQSKRTAMARKRLVKRIESGEEQDWKNLIAFLREHGPRSAFTARCHQMRSELPNSHWAALVLAHSQLSCDGKLNGSRFQTLVADNPKYFKDYVAAMRLYSDKTSFYEFATNLLPTVPEGYRDSCYREAFNTAYSNGDMRQAIRFCDQWNSKKSARYIAAAHLANDSPSQARSNYEKWHGPIGNKMVLTDLEASLLRGDMNFQLDYDETREEAFFPSIQLFACFFGGEE